MAENAYNNDNDIDTIDNDIEEYSYSGKSVRTLAGDFYSGSANRDRKKITNTINTINKLIETKEAVGLGDALNAEFLEYFNEIYNGRTAFNTLLNIVDYPVESVIRELLQNAFDCRYDSNDIRIAINFKNDGNHYIISLSYNETGFNLEQFLYYLSFGRNNGDLFREGRFGVGAKSVFLNTEWLSVRSNNFRLKITNNHGLLNIEKINLNSQIFKGTEISIGVDSLQFTKIKENFLSITEKRGTYINLPELCFAFNKKKVLNDLTSKEECRERIFNIAILDNNKLETIYTIQKHFNPIAGIEVIRFMQNKKGMVDFICCENEGYSLLVPFAVNKSKSRQIVRILTEKYNYFSTYELINKGKNANLSYKRSPAFFVSVPNRFVVPSRSGIRHDSIDEITDSIEAGLLKFVNVYGRFFVLQLLPCEENTGFYYLRPDSYIFEFARNFIQNKSNDKKLKKIFQNSISVLFPDETEAVSYRVLKQNAYSCCTKNVAEAVYDETGAYQKHIRDKLDIMETRTNGDRILYASYEWIDDINVNNDNSENQTDVQNETNKVYTYEFFRNGNKYVVDSRINSTFTDYNLYNQFIPFVFE